MDLVNIQILSDNYQLNYGVNSSVSCNITVKVTDFNDNPVNNYNVSIECPDDTSQTTRTGVTGANGVCNFTYTFSSGTGYRRFIVNNIKMISVYLYRDTGWFDALTYTSGYATKNDDVVKMRVVDKFVDIRGTYTNINAVTTPQNGNGLQVATLKYPQFAPSNSITAMMMNSPYKIYLELASDGTLWMARRGNTATNTQINASAWLYCYITYTI